MTNKSKALSKKRRADRKAKDTAWWLALRDGLRTSWSSDLLGVGGTLGSDLDNVTGHYRRDRNGNYRGY